MKKLYIILVLTATILLGCTGRTVTEVTGKIDSIPSEEISYPEEKPSVDEDIVVKVDESSSQPSLSEPSVDAEELKESEKAKAQAEEKLKQEEALKAAAEEKLKQEGALKAAAEEKLKQEEALKAEAEEKAAEDIPAISFGSTPHEVSAVWISYLEFLTLAKGQSEKGFTNNVDYLFNECSSFGFNTVFVQVRPFGDAMYPSKYFPWSYVMTGTEGVDPGYDPLEIMIKKSKEYNLRIEAWINPYRVRVAGSPNAIAEDNIVNQYIAAGSDAVIQYKGGTYYNPASAEARNLIIAGILEIMDGYDVDGIHLDDYFYPTTDVAFDAKSYNDYLKSGGKLSQGDWRRNNVNIMVSSAYNAIKQKNPNVLFGISPQARMDINYNSQYADVEKWLSNKGYVDYICPQIYFGFQHETVPYTQTVELWNNMAKKSGKDLYVGLAAYKCGMTDAGAKSGKNEWLTSTSMMADMVEGAREFSQYKGFAIYRFDSLFRPEASCKNIIAKEKANLKKVMQ